MNRSRHFSFNALAVLCSLFCLALASCGANGVGKGLPYTGVIHELDTQGRVVRWLHTDGDITVARYGVRADLELRPAVPGLERLAYSFDGADYVLVSARSMKYSERFAIGAPLPHWLAPWRGFDPGEAEEHGLTFASADSAPSPEPAPNPSP